MRITRKSLIVMAVVLGILLGAVGIAYAVTYGEPDGDGHPYVGMVAFYDGEGEYLWRCSGTLLSPTVLLTAGHCTFGTTTAKVRFDSEITDPEHPFVDGVPEIPNPHPGYDDFATFPNTSDVGVVVLSEPVFMDTYGELPELGALDELDTRRGHQDLVFRTVGYGLQSVKPDYQADRTRYTSTSLLVNLRSHLTDGYNLHTSNNPGKGHDTSGGSCFGDSGGPIFYPTDISNTQDFVSGFLPETLG